MHDPNYMSFLLRLSCSSDGSQPTGWRAEIEHIQSGNCHNFDTLDEAILWLYASLERLRAGPTSSADTPLDLDYSTRSQSWNSLSRRRA